MDNKILKQYLDKLQKMETFILKEAPGFIRDLVKLEYVKLQNSLILSSIIAIVSIILLGICFYILITTNERLMTNAEILASITGIFAALGFVWSSIDFIITALTYREYKVSEKVLAVAVLNKALKGKSYR